MLEVDELHAYYGRSHVLQGVSLTVAPGEVVAMLGRNGMGKTTLIRAVIGFLPSRRGRVHFKGRDVSRWPPFRIVQHGMGLVPQGRQIFPSLTVDENLAVARAGRGGTWTLERVTELFPRLRERARTPAGRLSGGEQQMLAIGRALMTDPDLLLMDEPTEGLAPLVVREVGQVVARLKASGLAILLVEQNMTLACSVADRVHILNRGRIVHSCWPAELLANHEAQAQYLGL